jgi:phospholipid/cholesterol/gamma-HCH transport system ATP-binding protein
VPPQVNATPGIPERKAVGRRQGRVREIMRTLPPAAQEVIRIDLEGSSKQQFGYNPGNHAAALILGSSPAVTP